MHFEGVIEVGAPRPAVFGVVTDPRQVAGCMPGLQKVDVKSPDKFEAVIKAGAGFIKGDFTMRFETTEKNPPTEAKMSAHGSGLGSVIDLRLTVRLDEEKDGGTKMSWGADATVSGTIASVGQRLVQSSAEKIITQFFECFRGKF